MDPMNAVQEFFPHFYPRPNKKTKQTQTTELAQGAAPNNNKKTQQQSWPTTRPKQKKETQQSLLTVVNPIRGCRGLGAVLNLMGMANG